MKILFHNPNGSTTTISGKTIDKIIATYIHKYNRAIPKRWGPDAKLSPQTFNIPYTIIKK